MKTFEASRLSEGNKIFPAKIKIDELGVTLKIPGFLGGKEKTLSYLDISSVNIDTPMIGYSKITFRTIGYDHIHATGFSKADALEIKQMVQQYAASARTGGLTMNAGNVNVSGGSTQNSDFAKAEAKKAEADLEAKKVEIDSVAETEMRKNLDYISRMTLSTDKEELSNQLNELVSFGSAASQYRYPKAMKKACYEKMEFGIMKLNQLGAKAEADYFEKKRKSIKPGFFDS